MRSFLAVLSGMILWPAICLPANNLVMLLSPDQFRDDGTTTNPALLSTILLISVIASVAAGYVCAWVARRRRLTHTFVLAIIQLLTGIFVELGYWSLLPVWYHLSFLTLLVPAILAGGWLRGRRSAVVQRAAFA